jgi:hypothetical protein
MLVVQHSLCLQGMDCIHTTGLIVQMQYERTTRSAQYKR